MRPLNRWCGLVLWALGDVSRQPFQYLMLFSTLAALTALLAVILLLNQALELTAERLMTQTPAMVVRRVCGGGWAPLPSGESLAAAGKVAGVLQPRARIWGTAVGNRGPLQIVGLTGETALPEPWSAPRPGEALIGPGVIPTLAPGADLALAGVRSLHLKVTGRLPDASAMALHDAVLVHADDARALLGLSDGQASDLALDVFHEEEIEAVARDLVRAMPWPVQISTRPENRRRLSAELAARSALGGVAVLPAALALAALVGAVGLWGRRQRRRMGLFKALGWTGADILALQQARAALVGVPAIAAGSAAGYLLLFQPGAAWISRLLFGWGAGAPGLYLTARSAAGPLMIGLLLTAVPFWAASFWSGRQGAEADPADLLEEA